MVIVFTFFLMKTCYVSCEGMLVLPFLIVTSFLCVQDCTVASLTLSGGRVQGCLLLVLIVVLWPSSVEPKKLFVDGIDTSLLQLKEVLHLVMEDGKLYNDSPNFTWIIKNSSCHKPPRGMYMRHCTAPCVVMTPCTPALSHNASTSTAF